MKLFKLCAQWSMNSSISTVIDFGPHMRTMQWHMFGDGRYQKLIKDNEQLIKDNKQLTSDKTQLIVEKKLLKTQNDKLKTRNDKLITQNNQLKDANETLTIQYHDQLEETLKLRDQNKNQCKDDQYRRLYLEAKMEIAALRQMLLEMQSGEYNPDTFQDTESAEDPPDAENSPEPNPDTNFDSTKKNGGILRKTPPKKNKKKVKLIGKQHYNLS